MRRLKTDIPIGKCGIYLIRNTVTGNCYVGQSRSIFHRELSHRRDLWKRKHCAARMQADHNQFGRRSFKFSVLEECLPEDLDGKEYEWMVRTRPVYNSNLPRFGAKLSDKKKDRLIFHRKFPFWMDPDIKCRCGSRRTFGWKWCDRCSRRRLYQMESDGYLVDGDSSDFPEISTDDPDVEAWQFDELPNDPDTKFTPILGIKAPKETLEDSAFGKMVIMKCREIIAMPNNPAAKRRKIDMRVGY